MKKQTKVILATLSAIACVGLMTGCKTTSNSNSTFVIRYYPGGYGKDFLDQYARAAVAEYKNISIDQVKEGVDYKLIADSNPAADKNLKSSTSCPDLIFANGVTASQISAGLFEPIQDVYETEVETSKGKMKIKDYLIDDCAQQFCFQRHYGQGQRLAYGMPFTNIPISIAYNETLLKNVEHVSTSFTLQDGAVDTTTKKWLRAPVTVEELRAYFKDIDNYNTVNNKNIVQFGWSLADGSNWFEPLYATWWAQLQGLDQEYKYPGEGSYYDFWKYESPEIYKQTGIQKAFETLQSLIVGDNGSGQKVFVNSHPNNATYTIKDIQPAFARGEVAMCLTGDFFEHEYADILSKSTDTFKLMRIPSVEDAEKNSNGTEKKLTFVNTSNCLLIPAKAKNKEIAKKFLVYSSQEAQVVQFLKDTGGIRAFNFDPNTLAGDHTFTPFQQSTIDLYFGADDLIMKFPRTAVDKNAISPIYFYEGVNETLFSVIDYASLLYAVRDYSAQQVCVESVMDGQIKKYECLYDRAVRAFENWNKIYNF